MHPEIQKNKKISKNSKKMKHAETHTHDEVRLGQAPGLIMVLNTPKGSNEYLKPYTISFV